MSASNWYNAERVSQPGSVILTRWREERQAVRALGENSSGQLTVDELSRLVSGIGGFGSGPVVNEDTAMRVSAVYACVALIAGAIATLPLPVYKRTPEGRERADHDYWWLLNEQPNPEVSAAVFWEWMLTAYLFHGDCFAEIIRPSFSSNRAVGFKPLHPGRVTPFREGGKLLYRVTPQDGPAYVVHPEDMIHVPGLGFNGLRSVSPITYAARQAIGTAIAAGDYSSRFFSNSARPDFALKTPGTLSEEQAKLLRATWGERHGGTANSHLPAVLTGGLEVHQLTMTAEDSQLIATRAFQIEEIARIFGVPPHMIGHTDKTTSWGSGVENMGRGFVKFTLQRHLVKFEQEFNRKLWPTRERFFVEFNVAGLERGDLKSENEALRIALGRAGEPGWMTPDEVRRIKNLPPLNTEASGKLNDGSGNAKGNDDEPPAETVGE